MKFRKIAAILLASTMILSTTATAFALDDSQANEYTQEAINRGGTGLGTVFGDSAYEEITEEQVKEVEKEIAEADKKAAAATASAATTSYPGIYPKELLTDVETMSNEQIAELIDAILPVMTFDEKIFMISMNTDPDTRSNVGYMPGIARLGIPESRMHDGPAGIQTNTTTYRETTSTPNQLVLGSTWSEDLTYAFGSVYGSEHVSNGYGWQLGTQYDLARTAYWARVKDTFGEDYMLAGELSTAYTLGLQESGGMGMAKHIGAYATDGDTSLWVEVDDQTLHTAYLYPFETASVNGQLASIMGTYNRLNGYYTSSNYHLQVDILRGMWDWGGAMVPDWGADKEFSLMLGTDISQSNFSKISASVKKAVAYGNLTLDRVDDAVENALYAYAVGGYLNLVEVDQATGLAKSDPSKGDPAEDGSGDRIIFEDTYEEDRSNGLYEENNATVQEIAEKGIVLLKNENDVLPIAADGSEKIAVVGSGAMRLMGGTGGERSFGVLEYMKTPAEALGEALGEENVNAQITNDIHGNTVPKEYLYLTADGEDNGLYMDRPADIEAWEEEKAKEEEGGPGGWAPFAAVLANSSDVDDTEDAEYIINREIEYLTTYKNENKAYFKNQEDGEAFSENGEAHIWKGYIEIPEAEYDPEDEEAVPGVGAVKSLVIQTNGGTAKVVINVDGETKSAQATSGVSWDDYTREGLNYKTVDVSSVPAGRYEITITTERDERQEGLEEYRDQALRLSWIMKTDEEENVQAAKDAITDPETDTVIMFTRTGATGHGPVFQTTWDLSLTDKEQISEFAELAKENGKNFVVVTFSRSAYTFEGGWEENTDALISSFYSGQSYAEALTNIITGEVNPSGKTVLSFPETSQSTLLTIPSKNSITNIIRAGNQYENEYTAVYEEGLNFGYRWYDSEEAIDADIQAKFSFGHGLSYTTFAYSNAAAVMDEANKKIKVTVDVTNTGNVKGDEIVQVYLGDIDLGEGKEYVQFAEKQLVAFKRINDIEPGQTVTTEMVIEERMLSYWDVNLLDEEDEAYDTTEKWVFANGERDIMFAAASDDIRLTIENFQVTDGETPGGETPGGENPGGENPGGENPGGENPGGETSDTEEPQSTGQTKDTDAAGGKTSTSGKSGGSSSKSSTVPKTGDTANLLTLLSIVVLSGLAVVVYIKQKKTTN